MPNVCMHYISFDLFIYPRGERNCVHYDQYFRPEHMLMLSEYRFWQMGHSEAKLESRNACDQSAEMARREFQPSLRSWPRLAD